MIFAVNDGPWDFAEPYRIIELQVDIGDNGDETVTLKLVAA